MMKKNLIVYLAPLIVTFSFLLDGQLSTLLINLAPGVVTISSHILLMVGIFLSTQIPASYSISLFALLGLVYDLYYLRVLGIAITLLPLLIYLIQYFYQNLKYKLMTNQIVFFVVLFIFKFASFLLARCFALTNLSMFIFVIYDLIPTVVVNFLIFLFLQPLLRSLFRITNKT